MQLEFTDREIVSVVRDYKSSNNLTWKAIARECGMSSVTLMNLCSDKEIPAKSDKWGDLRTFVLERLLPQSYEVMETEVYRQLEATMQSGIDRKLLLGVGMPPGFGKTYGCENLAARNRNVWYVCALDGMGPVNLLQEICTTLRIPRTTSGRTKYALQQSLIDWATARRGVLIIDEIDKVISRSFEVLREVYDKRHTSLSFMMVGETRLRERFVRPDRNGVDLKRMYSRTEYIEIVKIPEEDIKAYLKSHGITRLPNKQALGKIKSEVDINGGFRYLNRLVDYIYDEHPEIELGNDIALDEDTLLDAMARFK